MLNVFLKLLACLILEIPIGFIFAFSILAWDFMFIGVAIVITIIFFSVALLTAVFFTWQQLTRKFEHTFGKLCRNKIALDLLLTIFIAFLLAVVTS